MKADGLYFDCKVNGLSDGTFEVTEFELNEGLSELFTLTVRVVSAQSGMALEGLILKQAVLTVYINGEAQRTVTGFITEARLGKTGFHRTYYTLIIRPSLWLLTQRQHSRIFHYKSVPEIITQLMREHGVRVKEDIRDTHAQREYTVQRRESDYDFVSRLAAEEGITYWYEGEGEEAYCMITDSRLACKGGIELRYNDHPQSSHTERGIYHLSLAAQMTPQKVVGKDQLYRKPDYKYQHEARNKTFPNGDDFYYIYEGYGRYLSDGRHLSDEHNLLDKRAQTLTQYRLEAAQRLSEYGTAESNCIALRPGRLFEVTDHPNARLAAPSCWQVVDITHKGYLPQSVEEDNWGLREPLKWLIAGSMPALAAGYFAGSMIKKATEEQGAYLTNQLRFISSEKSWRPAYQYKPQAEGLEVATVVGPEGEEIYTNDLGQVKVHFHWNRHDAPTENVCCWVRVAQGWSGNGYGFYAVPRIGQDVVVSYEQGDIDRPLITGCVYNGNDTMPIKLPEDKTQTVFKTKTHKGSGFNELRFEDGQGKECVSIHAQRDLRTQVNENETHHVGKQRTQRIEGDEHLKIEGEKRQEVSKDYSLMLHQTGHISAESNLLLKSGEETHLSSGNRIVIDAGSEIILKVGGSFIQISEGQITVNPSFTVGGSCGTLGSLCLPLLPDNVEREQISAVITQMVDFSG